MVTKWYSIQYKLH